MLTLLAILGCESTVERIPDADNDGFTADIDCDDAEADAFPGAVEFCDGIDNDCDGEIDDAAVDAGAWFSDGDGDGYGVDEVRACDAPEGFVALNGDCDDADPEVRPLRTELCDGVDNDCDGLVDVEPDAPVFPDADGDGYGDRDAGVRTCTPTPGFIAVGGDCDDADPDVNPDAAEICDSLDNDCDGRVDDADEDTTAFPSWFPDADADGAGSDAFSVESCAPPSGPWSLSDDDCDDFDASIRPGATEFCNGIDEDCDGVIDGPGVPLVAGPSVPLAFSAVDALTDPVFVQTVDLQALFDAAGGAGTLDPNALRAVVGECGADFEELPVRFVDDLDDLGTPGVDGDAVGAMVVPFTGTLAAGATLDGRLYFAAPSGLGDATAFANQLSTSASTFSLDTVGGLVGVSPVGDIDQQAFRPRIETPAGAVVLDSATVTVDDHPALSRVRVEGAGTNGAGDVDWSVEWWVVSGRPELWGRLTATTAADTTVFHPVDWRSGVVSFSAALGGTPTLVGPDTLYRTATDGVLIRVLDAPGATLDAVDGWADLRGTSAAGPAGTLAVIPADTPLADTRILLVAGAGLEAADRVGEIDAIGILDVGVAGP